MSTQAPTQTVASLRRLPRIVTRTRSQDTPKLKRPIPLTCGHCGATHRYKVGTVVVNPAVQNFRTLEEVNSYKYTKCCGKLG